jgi:hypothetical protein
LSRMVKRLSKKSSVRLMMHMGELSSLSLGVVDG